MQVLNTEYRPDGLLAQWPLFLIGATVVAAGVLIGYYSSEASKTKGTKDDTSNKVADWFTSGGVDYIYFIVIALFFLIYLKYRWAFAPLSVLALFVLMAYLCLQYGNEGEKSVNKLVLVAAFVLPVVPLIVAMLKTTAPWMHGLVIAIYVLIVVLLLVINPLEFLGKYNQDTHSVYLVGIVGLFAMICVFINKNVVGEQWPPFVSRLGFMLLCLVTVGFTLQYAIRFFMQGPSLSANYIIMLLILVGFGFLFLSMVVPIIPRPDMGYYSTGNLVKLFFAAMLCKLQDLISTTKPIVPLVLLAEILLIVYYVLSRQFYTKLLEGGLGKQLFNEPVKLNKIKIMPIEGDFKYNYAVSCWIWLMPQPPEESPTSSMYANVLDYAGKPRILYNAALNTLRITMRRPAKEGETAGANILMADIPKIPLQRWHHIVLSYNNGLFDIFLNGSLYLSVPAVVDSTKGELSTGVDQGNKGKICNLVFYSGGGDAADPFTKSMDAITADKVVEQYNQFVNKSPPIISRIISTGPVPSYLNMRV